MPETLVSKTEAMMQSSVDLQPNDVQELLSLFDTDSKDRTTFCGSLHAAFRKNLSDNKDMQRGDGLSEKFVPLKLFEVIASLVNNPDFSINNLKSGLIEHISECNGGPISLTNAYDEIFLMELFMMTDTSFVPTAQSKEEWKLDGKLDDVFRTKLQTYCEYLKTPSASVKPHTMGGGGGSGGGGEGWSNAINLGYKTAKGDIPAAMKIGYETSFTQGKSTVSLQGNVMETISQSIPSDSENPDPQEKLIGGDVTVGFTNQKLGNYTASYAKGSDGSGGFGSGVNDSKVILGANKTFKLDSKGKSTISLQGIQQFGNGDTQSSTQSDIGVQYRQKTKKGSFTTGLKYQGQEKKSEFGGQKKELITTTAGYNANKVSVNASMTNGNTTTSEGEKRPIQQLTVGGQATVAERGKEGKKKKVRVGANLNHGTPEYGDDKVQTSGDVNVRIEF